MPEQFPETLSTPELPNLTLSKLDVEFLGDAYTYRRIRDFAVGLGFEPGQLLIRGGSRRDMDSTGNFVYERDVEAGSLPDHIWAFTNAQFEEAARQTDLYGNRDSSSPLTYAFGTDESCIAVLDATKLEVDAVSGMQYRPATGFDFRDALIAIVDFDES